MRLNRRDTSAHLDHILFGNMLGVDGEELLTAGLISAVIGEQLPGHGTVYLGQSLKFLAPVRPGDMVLAEVEVTDIDHSKRRVTMNTRCLVNDKKVLVGDATVLAPSRKFD